MDKRIGQITDVAIEWPELSVSGKKSYNRPSTTHRISAQGHFVVMDVPHTPDIEADIKALKTSLQKPSRKKDSDNATE
jgi:hypothetical protein